MAGAFTLYRMSTDGQHSVPTNKSIVGEHAETVTNSGDDAADRGTPLAGSGSEMTLAPAANHGNIPPQWKPADPILSPGGSGPTNIEAPRSDTGIDTRSPAASGSRNNAGSSEPFIDPRSPEASVGTSGAAPPGMAPEQSAPGTTGQGPGIVPGGQDATLQPGLPGPGELLPGSLDPAIPILPPEASDPGTPGLAPEASDPGVSGPAPEDS